MPFSEKNTQREILLLIELKAIRSNEKIDSLSFISPFLSLPFNTLGRIVGFCALFIIFKMQIRYLWLRKVIILKI